VRQAIRWARLWSLSAQIGLTLSRADAGRHLLVRYEDLTADPRGTIRVVCEFLGIAAEEEAMLALSGYEAKENSSFAVSGSGTYESAIRRSDGIDRRALVPRRKRAAIAAVCAASASALGYELDPRPSFAVPTALAAKWGLTG
jgi:hypothetical protein